MKTVSVSLVAGLCVALGLGAFYAEWTVGLP